MLCGFFEPSAGTALVEGYDITKDMDSVYTIMSVCPQDNLLWESLTGVVHLFAPCAPPPTLTLWCDFLFCRGAGTSMAA